MNPILVTGATGNTGSLLISQLAKQGIAVRSGSRRNHQATGDGNPITAMRFDWFDPSTHVILQGVERIYLVPPTGILDPVPVMMPFLQMARKSGVRRVVLLSAAIVQRGDLGLGKIHDVLPDMFPEWVVLRPSWFMQNFSGSHPHANSIREQSLIRTAAGHGRIGFIDANDIARTAAHALLSEKSLNRDLVLTGPETLSYDDIAEIISTVRNPDVTHQHVSAEQLQQFHIDSGLPYDFAARLAQADQLIASGSEDYVSVDVEVTTGTAPIKFVDFASKFWSQA